MRAQSPLIPRRKLFGNPAYFDGKISPDGSRISWLAAVDGVMNIWVAPSDDVKSGEPVTRTTGRPLDWHVWSEDSRFVLFSNDETGDENDHLFAADPATKDLRDLTPYPNICATLASLSRDVPGAAAVRINDRDARWHDLYRIDLAAGQRTLLWQNTQGLLNISNFGRGLRFRTLDKKNVWFNHHRYLLGLPADFGTVIEHEKNEKCHSYISMSIFFSKPGSWTVRKPGFE